MKSATICLVMVMGACVRSDHRPLFAQSRKQVLYFAGYKGFDPRGYPLTVFQRSGPNWIGTSFQLTYVTPYHGRTFYIRGLITRNGEVTSGEMWRVTNRVLYRHCPKQMAGPRGARKTWKAKLVDTTVKKITGGTGWVISGKYVAQIWDEQKCKKLREVQVPFTQRLPNRPSGPPPRPSRLIRYMKNNWKSWNHLFPDGPVEAGDARNGSNS